MRQEPDTHRTLKFGNFALDLDRQMLFQDGQELHLRPKAFELLVFLAQRPSILVTPDEILENVWPGVITNRNSIAQCLKEIRETLGDTDGEIIRTLPRKGLIFDQPVYSNTAKPHKLRAGLRVGVAWTSITAALATLILWGVYSGEPESSLNEKSQAEQYVAIAEELQNRRGQGDIQRAIEWFRKATELDPASEAAWVGLGSALFLQAAQHQPISVTEQVQIKQALDQALRRNSLNPEAHIRYALLLRNTGEMEAALRHFKLAMQHGADNPLVLTVAAGIAQWAHDIQLAVDLQQRAKAIEPTRAVYHANYGHYLFRAGRMEEARAAFQDAALLSPDMQASERDMLVRIELMQKNWDTAAAHITQLHDPVERDILLELLYVMSARKLKPDEIIARLKVNESIAAAMGLAEIMAQSGKPAEAFHWLDTAQTRSGGDDLSNWAALRLSDLRYSPFLHPLQDYPQWSDWLARIESLCPQPPSLEDLEPLRVRN